MATIYQPKRGKPRRSKQRNTSRQGTLATVAATIDTWDARGRGVSRSHQPVLFADGALPGETCRVAITKQKKQVCEGLVVSVEQASEHRIAPFCSLAEQCGGCALQHVAPEPALQWRQQALDSQFRRHHRLAALPWHPPIVSAHPGYRRKTRLAVDARDKNNIKLGFRAAGSSAIVDVPDCPVLVPVLNTLLPALHKVVRQLKRPEALGHISLLASNNDVAVTFRITQTLSQQDREHLCTFAEAHQVVLRADYGDNGTELLWGEQDSLKCETANDCFISVTTEDFVQVNHEVNLAMVQQALDWLDLQPDDKVLDLFCGLGNFSLPMARKVSHVTAVEGIATMVQRADLSAQQQGITNISWRCEDLSNSDIVSALAIHNKTKVLLDPSREGAHTVCEQLAKRKVGAIVYVSCNPATLDRDIAPLLAAGYRINKVALMEMFPYTQHVEMMMLLTPQ
ncbi:23S rRNA (uracil1939-C5)-methyltransferase [Marisediminitalea aggregata]|uniref:23S rRNA (Uracil1939-C5)-methyltransferase n=1 Tax=Marisediminitalea aggregata TaxID=634436 RepID=A0A1M5HPP0_9ALTE|nr:23S rRNA (uracil(1939)-C(5))-methyltransferase RlmD [Marisediminitalea aggregata]SHG17944.1 23S rRNA (uracil1939-C5)-methyltransferase [Marisediminitalea aggregata]